MNRRSPRVGRGRLLLGVVVLAIVASACSGGDDTAVVDDPTDTASVAPTATATPTSEKSESQVIVPASPSATPTETATAPAPPPEPTATPVPTATATGGGLEGRPAGEEFGGAMDDIGGQTTYDGYTTITDDTGAIEVEVPTEWSDVDGRPYNDEQGRQLFDVRAAPDLQPFAETWDVPGIIVTASTEVAQSQNEETLLDELVGPFSGVCSYTGRQPYDDGLYTGQADVYENCGGTDTAYLVVGAVPASRSFVVRVQVQVVEERDLEALERALASFIITGDV
ncbi:MAG: hypothetical protein ACR2HR_01835 [Euzebya sp.]